MYLCIVLETRSKKFGELNTRVVAMRAAHDIGNMDRHAHYHRGHIARDFAELLGNLCAHASAAERLGNRANKMFFRRQISMEYSSRT